MYKPLKYFPVGCFLMLIFISFNASAQNFIKTNNGLIVYPDESLSSNIHAVKVDVVSDKIIRVTASATDSFQNKSLIVLDQSTQK